MSKEVQRWVDRSMYESEEITDALPRVTLLTAQPDPLGAMGAMCAMYEGRVVRDISDLTDDDRIRYWEQVQKTHLKAPLEAIDLHFMVENVSRAFTHQMVRQRTAVYAQESMRFAVKTHVAARPGPLIQNDSEARERWQKTIDDIWMVYNDLVNNYGIPAEEARGLLPHDTLTRLNFKTNLRNLAEHMGNRLCTQAQFEWKMVAVQIRQAIARYESFVPYPNTIRNSRYDGQDRKLSDTAIGYDTSWQFKLIAESTIFRPVCFAMGRCPFQADFDRGCTIRERMDSGRQDEVEDREWLLDPTAAWKR